jgi:hypothetical protein
VEKTSPRQMQASSNARSPMRLVIMALAVLAALSSGTRTAQAADTPPALAKYAGEYKYTGTKDQGNAIIEKALDEALSELNMVMRLMIKKAMPQTLIEKILIEIPSGKIGIKMGDLQKVTCDVGKSETVKTPDGKYTGKVTHLFDGNKITETSAWEGLLITNVLQLSADGKTLHRSVVAKSDRLEKPVKYKLDYKKQ